MTEKNISKQWKWTYGDNYEKTPRLKKEAQYMDKESLEVIANNAYKQSFLSENDNWTPNVNDSILTSFDNNLNKEIFNNPNRREITHQKIAERDMIGTIAANPFMEQNIYSNDICVQDEFLKPKNTTLQ